MSLEIYDRCIDACLDCIAECKHCVRECLNDENVKMLSHCIRLNNECADICLVTSNMMVSESEFVHEICSICCIICDACSRECDKYAHLEQCKKCSDICAKCSYECRQVMKMSEVHVH